MLPIDTILSKKIKERQTVIDFACQHAGTLEALFDVAVLNGVSITQNVAPGTMLLTPVEDLKTVAFYNNNVVDIVTNQNAQPVPGGIGYMQIGTSFKVN